MPEYIVHAAMLLLAMLGGVRSFATTTLLAGADAKSGLPLGASCDGDSQCASGVCLCKEMGLTNCQNLEFDGDAGNCVEHGYAGDPLAHGHIPGIHDPDEF